MMGDLVETPARRVEDDDDVRVVVLARRGPRLLRGPAGRRRVAAAVVAGRRRGAWRRVTQAGRRVRWRAQVARLGPRAGARLRPPPRGDARRCSGSTRAAAAGCRAAASPSGWPASSARRARWRCCCSASRSRRGRRLAWGLVSRVVPASRLRAAAAHDGARARARAARWRCASRRRPWCARSTCRSTTACGSSTISTCCCRRRRIDAKASESFLERRPPRYEGR